MDRFTCVQYGRRDGYEVPAGLHGVGLLEALVTDAFAPRRGPPLLTRALAIRSHPLLRDARVRSDWVSTAVELSVRRAIGSTARLFPRLERRLTARGLAEAKRSRSHLYCYSSFVPAARERPSWMRLIDFEFHPLPQITAELLREDRSRFPEVARSFKREERLDGVAERSWSWREADAIVCASSMTRRSLEYVGCPPERITVIPYGVYSPSTPTPVRSRSGSVTRFLFVGQGVQRKGLHHLIRAWQAADLPDAELTLVCYNIDPGVAALIRSPTITLLGKQRRAELDALFDRADIFVMPSLVEGFGLVYGEALGRGCHAVGTPNTGLADLPLSEGEATLVPVADVDALASALGDLHARHRSGGLDPVRIAEVARRWDWESFRTGIADHARGCLANWSGAG